MGIRQVDKLYKKMIAGVDADKGEYAINARVRSEIYQKIMNDVERLLKKAKSCEQGTEEFRETNEEIRQLLLKEVQVIIDDYIVARENGTLTRWKNKYGDVEHYKQKFRIYRQKDCVTNQEDLLSAYGLVAQSE